MIAACSLGGEQIPLSPLLPAEVIVLSGRKKSQVLFGEEKCNSRNRSKAHADDQGAPGGGGGEGDLDRGGYHCWKGVSPSVPSRVLGLDFISSSYNLRIDAKVLGRYETLKNSLKIKLPSLSYI